MATRDDFFEATGPTHAGFRTNGTRIARGVEVTGTDLGVLGSEAVPVQSVLKDTEDRTVTVFSAKA